MLNLLPALILLLVHGSGDPESLRVRESAYRLLIVQVHSAVEPSVEVAFTAPSSGDRIEDQVSNVVFSRGERIWTEDALARHGFGSSAVPRDGPAV